MFCHETVISIWIQFPRSSLQYNVLSEDISYLILILNLSFLTSNFRNYSVVAAIFICFSENKIMKHIFGFISPRPDRLSSFFGDEMIVGSFLSRLFPFVLFCILIVSNKFNDKITSKYKQCQRKIFFRKFQLSSIEQKDTLECFH